MSLEKSRIFFFKNVSQELGKAISDESQIKSTHELGKYLGMPVLHKRINKETFGDLLERMSSKLPGWKGSMLSAACRITLTKAVLVSIPVHAMSTIKLSSSTLVELDKVSRNFIWGSTTEKRRQHLVAWDKVYLPKSEGGLGIQKASDMNKALIAKIGWRLLHKNESLWAKVVRSKYKVGHIKDHNWMMVKNRWSATWRSVGIGLRDVICRGHSWVIGDGANVSFWLDKWLSNEPLRERTRAQLPEEFKNLKARDLWVDGRGWDLDKKGPYVSENKRLELAPIVLDSVTGAKDRLSWGEMPDDKFMVKSAYAMLTRDGTPKQDMETFYRQV